MIDAIHDFLLSFGLPGALAWIVLKILAIAVPVIARIFRTIQASAPGRPNESRKSWMASIT